MSQIPTDRAALDEYMAVWFRSEVSDTFELRSMVVRVRTQVQGNIWSRRRAIDHLESIKDCPTYGWLKRLKENHEEDSTYSEVLGDLVDKLCASILKKENDASDMEY
uniref:Uncharacterized protein n=1 Tax=Tanacetum cinerariifolium TaxID=118510 RepID=A0A6L2JHP1_TANCI|nr:hypothetical protein [Tanacetum cinerariifolium]